MCYQVCKGSGISNDARHLSSNGVQFQEMAKEQDMIGWRRFMEGMISKKLVCIHEDCHALTGRGLSAISWASQLVVRLLEVVTHGQWIYRNVQVHDEQQGTLRGQVSRIFFSSSSASSAQLNEKNSAERAPAGPSSVC